MWMNDIAAVVNTNIYMVGGWVKKSKLKNNRSEDIQKKTNKETIEMEIKLQKYTDDI
jgi:hypothetical protein